MSDKLAITKSVLEQIDGWARKMKHCEFLGLLARHPSSQVISAAATLPCQQCSVSHATASGAVICEFMDWILKNNMIVSGMVHGHSHFAVFHSEVDNQSLYHWLPRIAEMNRDWPGKLAPQVLGPRTASLPGHDGDGLRIELCSSNGIKVRWEKIDTDFLDEIVTTKCLLSPRTLILEGGNVRLTLHIPPHSQVLQTTERAPGTVGRAYSLVVNAQGEHFCELILASEASGNCFVQKLPCELIVVDEPTTLDAIINRDFIYFMEANFATSFGDRYGLVTYALSGTGARQ